MKTITFAQLYCGIISIICLVIVTIMFFVVIRNPGCLKDPAVSAFLTGISATIITELVACYKFITGSTSGSQAKDQAQMESTTQLIDKLANSVPVVAKTNP